jgi:hypothetical protein
MDAEKIGRSYPLIVSLMDFTLATLCGERRKHILFSAMHGTTRISMYIETTIVPDKKGGFGTLPAPLIVLYAVDFSEIS